MPVVRPLVRPTVQLPDLVGSQWVMSGIRQVEKFQVVRFGEDILEHNFNLPISQRFNFTGRGPPDLALPTQREGRLRLRSLGAS